MELQELKDYLQITWSEKDDDLKRIILRGEAYLNEVAGVELDYKEDAVVVQLLLDYCRYVYNHSLELFEVNFKRELLRLSIREGVKKRAKTKNDEATIT